MPTENTKLHRSTLWSVLCALSIVLVAVRCGPKPNLEFEHELFVPIDVALEDVSVQNTAAVRPHITVFRAFVRSGHVYAVAAIVANLMAGTNREQLRLTATGASPELQRLEDRMLEGLRLSAVDPDVARPSVMTADGALMSDDILMNVSNFVAYGTGVNFRPHVTVVQGQQAPDALTFKPVSAAIYQLDHLGNAQRTLWTWTGEIGAR